MFVSVFTDELSLDIRKTIPYLKEWGLQTCDLRGLVLHKGFEDLNEKELMEVKKLLDDNGLKVGCLQSSLGKVHLPEADRVQSEMEKLERIISASEILDCKLVRSFFFWQPEKEFLGEFAIRPDLQARVMKIFLPFANRAKEGRLRMAFENCGCTQDECFKLLDLLDAPGWGIAWDPKNSWMQDKAERETGLDAYIKKMAKRTICLHVKSIGTISDDNGQAEYIPYDKIFEELVACGFTGPVSVETHNYNRSLTNIEATKRILDVVRKNWPKAAPGAQQERCSASQITVREWSDNPVRFGIVGLGMGHNRAKEIVATPGLELVQVCDLRKERCMATSEACKVPCTLDFQEMLENPEVEVVMVMNETGRHAELGCRALDASKHVLMTKPLEMSVEECDRLIARAKKRNRLLAVDHCRRLRPSIQSLKRAVENHFFGRLFGVTACLKIRRDMKYFQSDGGWRGTRKLDGGVMSNQMVHHVDEILFAFGMPSECRCDVWRQNHEIEMEDLGSSVWKFPSGMVANLYATTCFPQESWYFRMEVHGSDGAYLHSEGGPDESPVTKYWKDGQWSDTVPFPCECEWKNSMDNFAMVLRKGGRFLTTPEEGRNAVQVIHAMYESGYETEGGWVKL